jgi:hypothetical protein
VLQQVLAHPRDVLRRHALLDERLREDAVVHERADELDPLALFVAGVWCWGEHTVLREKMRI